MPRRLAAALRCAQQALRLHNNILLHLRQHRRGDIFETLSLVQNRFSELAGVTHRHAQIPQQTLGLGDVRILVLDRPPRSQPGQHIRHVRQRAGATLQCILLVEANLLDVHLPQVGVRNLCAQHVPVLLPRQPLEALRELRIVQRQIAPALFIKRPVDAAEPVRRQSCAFGLDRIDVVQCAEPGVIRAMFHLVPALAHTHAANLDMAVLHDGQDAALHPEMWIDEPGAFLFDELPRRLPNAPLVEGKVRSDKVQRPRDESQGGLYLAALALAPRLHQHLAGKLGVRRRHLQLEHVHDAH
mmetsp:Transcript_43907/g.127837  ORF Transcript_43907/g.127837 Transcript_43907/m.127837 type:complete len:299 (-) Transcript_43907:491-1387(-)